MAKAKFDTMELARAYLIKSGYVEREPNDWSRGSFQAEIRQQQNGKCVIETF